MTRQTLNGERKRLDEEDREMMTPPWPQPHEGITGTDRDDWLLSLDEHAIPHREALIAMARHLRTATTVGQPAPVVRRMSERIRAPQPGDLVVVEDVIWRRDPDDRLKGFGILLAARREWETTDGEWEACLASEYAEFRDLAERLTDDVFYIQYGSSAGDVCRWHNARCMTLPVQVHDFAVPARGPDERDGVTFTRDSLTEALADSGFRLRQPPPEVAP